MGKRTVQDAIVDDIQKRKYPTKHYEYVIHVSWSDGSVNVIYRRYSRFFDFQMKLLSLFPVEAGVKNPTQRMIPFLPGKKLFGRSQTREVASKRLGQLNEYCQLLVRLPAKVSDCDEVLQFFTPTTEDINPTTERGVIKKIGKEIDVISDPIQPDPYIVIADYKKNQKNEVDLQAGDNVEVFEKSDNGWWFVSCNDSQGWAPATFLSRADGGEDEDSLAGNEERFISNNSYKAQQEDEVSFETGVVLIVIQKSLDGWWKIRYLEKEGWVPAAFLQLYTGPADVTSSAPTQLIGNVMSISDIHSRRHAAESSKNSPVLRKKENLHGHGTEAKPTPPRRSTVRRTVRKGATRIKRPPAKKTTQLEYYTVADYSESDGDSISFQSGQKVQVIQETESGWWLVKIGDEEGWAPSSYIKAKEETMAETRPPPSNKETLDEETGESSPRPPRPPPPSGIKVSSGGGGGGGDGLGGGGGGVSSNISRPVAIPGVSKSSGAASAFRPVPIPTSNNGRPLPITPDLKPVPKAQLKPFRPSSGGGLNLVQNAQANLVQNLKPASGQSKPPPTVNRRNKPAAGSIGGPTATPRSNVQPSQIAELRSQLKSLNAPSSRGLGDDRKPSNAYVTTAAYENSDVDGLSFEEGVRVEMLQENDTGWWMVRIAGEVGWAPSTYLEKA